MAKYRKSTHGLSQYRQYNCRCKMCCKAYEKHLISKRVAHKGRSDRSSKLPSVTNTLIYDTMTRGQYDRLRNESTS